MYVSSGSLVVNVLRMPRQGEYAQHASLIRIIYPPQAAFGGKLYKIKLSPLRTQRLDVLSVHVHCPDPRPLQQSVHKATAAAAENGARHGFGPVDVPNEPFPPPLFFRNAGLYHCLRFHLRQLCCWTWSCSSHDQLQPQWHLRNRWCCRVCLPERNHGCRDRGRVQCSVRGDPVFRRNHPQRRVRLQHAAVRQCQRGPQRRCR